MLLKIQKLSDQGTANKNIMSTSHLRYLHVAQDVLKQIEATQTDAIAQASEMCAETIAARRPRLPVRIGAFPYASRRDFSTLREFPWFLSHR